MLNHLATTRRGLLAGLGSLGLAGIVRADEKTLPPDAEKEDVESIDAILAALYDVISGEKDQKRDWERFKTLFVSGATLIPCSGKNEQGKVTARVLTPEGFAELASLATRQSAFYEKEISRKTDRFGHMAHVLSTYESRLEKDAAEPFARGINSFQLLWDNSRWWVVTIFWDQEADDQPIPAEYLPKV